MKKEIIGVIGGIASGKSTVLSILQRDFSYRILRMDELAKALYQEEAVLREMRELYPFQDLEVFCLLSRRERSIWKN